MKLDYDCVRDVLVALEDLCAFDNETSSGFKELSIFDLEDYMKEYTNDEVYYTVLKLMEAQYIKTESVIGGIGAVELLIIDITYEGHQYLNSIRDPKIWKTIKESTSSLTFTVILKAAEKLIMNQFGL